MINTAKLKAKLKERNMTQEELAKLMGKNPATINFKLNNEIGETLTIEETSMMKDILQISVPEMVKNQGDLKWKTYILKMLKLD